MDKIKLVLDILKKYLFWLIFAATVAVVLIFWWMSTKSLANSFQLQKLRVEKKFSEVKAVADDAQHPTSEYIAAIKGDENGKFRDKDGNIKDCQTKVLKEGVLSVWKTLYDEQKKDNHWPEILGSEFINIVDKLDPTERIPENQRDRYKYVIKNYFPVLYKIIDLRHPVETAESGGGGNVAPVPRQIMGYRIPVLGLGGRRPTGGAEDNTADWVGTVIWDPLDRQRLEERFDWKTTPDSDVIRLRQEDLWVYKALLEVIRETNNEGSPNDPVIAANVKRIESIQIGADAVGAWTAADQSIFKAPDAAAAVQTGANTRSAP